MNMMLKAMRDATPQDDLMDSEQSRLYTSMLDQQLSQSMASRGVGLADVMIRQLRGGLPPEPKQETPGPASAIEGQRPAGDISSLVRLKSNPITQQRAQPPASAAEPRLSSPSSPLAPPANPRAESLTPVVAQPGAHSHVMEFQAKLMPYAQQASQATGIPALFMLGQAALESGWGKRELRGLDGTPSYNLFGVKAGANWKGAVVESVTTEYVNGVARKGVEKFRAYSSYADAFGDYANLLRSNPRYAQVLAQAVQGLDAESFAQGLQQAGYATDPDYADKLSQIIRTTQWSGEAPL